MRHELQREIEIEAPPEEVWAVLVDLEAYPDWNPYITSARGDLAVGDRIVNRMAPPGGKAMTFRPTITALDEPRTFEWLGRLGLPGVFDGRHRFELHPIPGGTRLVQSERFRGLLVRFLRTSLDTHTIAGFDAMNAALKTRVEARMAAV